MVVQNTLSSTASFAVRRCGGWRPSDATAQEFADAHKAVIGMALHRASLGGDG